MKRLHVRLIAAVAATVITASCTSDPAAPTSLTPVFSSQERTTAGNVDEDEGENAPSTYAVIGDVPYEPRTPSALSVFPTLIGAINADPDVSRAIHIGDIKSGSTRCSDSWFQTIATSFGTFADPLVYTPGDNEWTDCHRANNGGYNPLERLAKIRQLFFAEPGRTLGVNPAKVKDQRGYPENVTWSASRVQFATFHVIGSNNGRERDRKSVV